MLAHNKVMGVSWLLFDIAYFAFIYALHHVKGMCEVGYLESYLYRAYLATIELRDGSRWYGVACLDETHRTFQLSVQAGAKIQYNLIVFVASRDSQTCNEGYYARFGILSHPLAPPFYTELYMDSVPDLVAGPDKIIPFPYSLS